MIARPHRRRLPMVTIEEVLNRAQRWRSNGHGWSVACPCEGHKHGDRNLSGSVAISDSGNIVVWCFWGHIFEEIVAAWGFHPSQFFAPSDEPWTPRPRRGPRHETRESWERLRAKFRPPSLDRMHEELRFIGRVILGGTKAYAEIGDTFDAEWLRTPALRLIFWAIKELAGQRTPRRWFSVVALSREVDLVDGSGSGARHDVFFWSRWALGMAVLARREEAQGGISP